MNFLLVNDDGYKSEYLKETKRALENFGTVYTCAPYSQQSGASTSIKNWFGGKYHLIDENTIALEGTPADCGFFGISYFLDKGIDYIVSGTNYGFNTSYYSLYSGTFGGAISASLSNVKAIILSGDEDDLDNIYNHAYNSIKYVLDSNILSKCDLVSINYPMRNTINKNKFVLSHIYNYPIMESLTFNKEMKEYMSSHKDATEYPKDSDMYQVSHGYYSVTPIKASYEDFEAFKELEK